MITIRLIGLSSYMLSSLCSVNYSKRSLQQSLCLRCITVKILDPTLEGWEARARAWLSGLPEGHTVSMSEVENWVKFNNETLPEEIKSMSQSDLLQRFSALQRSLQPSPPAVAPEPPQVKTVSHVEYPFRFQRTDRWLPVYTWLESLNADEVVKSKDISDWLSANPQICEQLCSRHSRYHLTHYIKKCHAKILKRQDKLKIEQPKAVEQPSEKVNNANVPALPALMPSNQLVNIPRDGDLFQAKQKEALRKYEILVELEKQLASVIRKQLGQC